MPATTPSTELVATVRTIDGYRVEIDALTSLRMSGIRQRDTKPERAVRLVLHHLGHRFRTRNRDLPGAPDIANRSRRWVIFVHGCYWHRHEGCRRTTTPKRNADFWNAKFEANQARDQRVQAQLRDLGYRVLVVWECDAGNPTLLAERLASELPAPAIGGT